MIRSFRDYIALTKPRITFFCVLMAAGGLLLAPQLPSPLTVALTLLFTACSVGSANAFNMIYERDTDKLMARTRFRPLAQGRVAPLPALLWAFALLIISFVGFWKGVSPLTAWLSLGATAWYVLIYTPLKYKAPLALVVGAIPGAMPPLLGWCAATGRIAGPGLALFLILFAWQMPHFIAIALMHQEDYKRAGIKVVPWVRGIKVAKIQSMLWTLVLIGASLILVPWGVGSWFYFVGALALGAWYLRLSLQGFCNPTALQWPRKFFLASLVYLPVLVCILALDKIFHLS